MTTQKIAVILTFDATQCVDVTPDQYDPTPDLQSICEYGAENFNLTDWETVDSGEETPRFIVDGHTFQNPESDLASDGEYPPFMIFMPVMQDYLPCTFKTRAEAESVCGTLNAPALFTLQA